MDRSECETCAGVGPALLPVRYSVVPDRVVETLPKWAETPKPSAAGYHYALRALRQGFLYVYYANAGLFEQESWDAWSISEDGGLWKQFCAPFGVFPKKNADCYSPTHQSANMEFIVLQDIALRQETWLAFSASAWSWETIEYYHNNRAAREKRMQCVQPWQWSGVPEGVGIAQATVETLSDVMDYHAEDMYAAKYLLPCNPKAARISRTLEESPYYTFTDRVVEPQGTLYPWSGKRAGNADITIRAMQRRGQAADGTPVSAVLMALHDPIGIAHELAGWSDDIVGAHKTWLDELSIEFMTDSSLNGVENQLHQMKTSHSEEKAERHFDTIKAMISGHASAQDLVKLKKDVTRNTIKLDNQMFASDWEKYTAELNLAKRQAFHQKYADFCTAVANKLEQLAQFRVNWLKQNGFITCCQDFHSTRLEDNLNYREAVDYAMASLNVTETGSAFLDDQIDQYSALSPENIVWRSLLLNNPDVMKEMDGFLQKMKLNKGNDKPADSSDFMKTVTTLGGKLVEAYDKANEALEKPPASNSTFARAMLHCDRRMVTLGDRFFNFTRLGKVLNSTNEMLSKGLFLVISGVPFDQAVDLSISQLKEGNAFRQQVLEQLKRPGAEARLETRNSYNDRFKEFAESAEGEPVLKKSRIKLLVLFFNGLEYANQLKESKEDTKSHAQVTAAFLSTLNTAMEIVEPMVKHGIKNMSAANTIKFIGTNAGAVSAALNLGVDISDLYSEYYGKGRWQFIGLYGLKSAYDFMQFATALKGLLEVLVKRALLSPKSLIVEGVAKLLAWETLAWLCSWEAMLVIFLVEELVTYFSDNDLQKWCRSCVFGLEPAKNLQSTQSIYLESQRNELCEEQRNSFANAIKEGL
ncbi:T6SS effector BTH_I2691 family protein [Photorhabdus asymbiotica]|uniref:T6SS effector BTH_I2691 family protein n=1 Tax=Photorhabdus asymbiotica TaxID=291112 RepID=UPI003DA721AF